MKVIGFRFSGVVTFLLFASGLSSLGQGTFSIDLRMFPSPLSAYHIDEVSVVSAQPIRTLEASIRINPMYQVHPGGSLSVFPTLLNAADAERDSHFVFDTSSATILAQYEDSAVLSTSVEFLSNYPMSFTLGRAVALEGHSPYEVTVFGTFVNGESFADSIAFVPEPSVMGMVLTGALALVFGSRTRRHGVG